MPTDPNMRIVVIRNGPYLVYGDVPLVRMTIGVDAEGGSTEWITGATLPTTEQPCALCRCGKSKNKPFCDGSHKKAGFNGTETASREPYEAQAKRIDGPGLQLLDAESLCAFARYCDPQGSVWAQVEHTEHPTVRATFLRQVGNCPSGRLVARDPATGELLEPELSASIGVVDDPAKQCAGPLWLRGGIPVVSEDGTAYEVRNRVALCRCGQSDNKPFCDGTHVEVNFRE